MSPQLRRKLAPYILGLVLLFIVGILIVFLLSTKDGPSGFDPDDSSESIAEQALRQQEVEQNRNSVLLLIDGQGVIYEISAITGEAVFYDQQGQEFVDFLVSSIQNTVVYEGVEFIIDSDGQNLFILRDASGNYILQPVSNLQGFGVNEHNPVGLVNYRGSLLMVGRDLNALLQLSPATGHAQRVGEFVDFGQQIVDPRYLLVFTP